MKMLESCLKVDHERFLPYPFQFIIHYSPQINRRHVVWTIQGVSKQTTGFPNVVHRLAVWTQHRMSVAEVCRRLYTDWENLRLISVGTYTRYSPVPTHGTPQHLPTVLPSPYPRYSPVPTHDTPQSLPMVLSSFSPQQSLFQYRPTIPPFGYSPQYLPSVHYPGTYTRFPVL